MTKNSAKALARTPVELALQVQREASKTAVLERVAKLTPEQKAAAEARWAAGQERPESGQPTDANFVATFPGRSNGKRAVWVAVEWGYETHEVLVSAADWENIQAGEERSLESTGAYEGERFDIVWNFNCGPQRQLIVSYGDDGADGYIGPLSGVHVRSA